MQESGEMYLETIYILLQKGAPVRSLDIAERMNFSKPSVSRAVGLLREGKYIEVDANGYITLSDSGREIAARIYDRHATLTSFFVNLGVPQDVAAADACKIEHDISDVTFDALKAHAQNGKV